ncbi:hypothetical protein BS17DRAFT_704638, partial [Gyrodon lividus]
AFQLTWTSRDHEELLGEGHWIWADSAYSPETWCIVPFKKQKNGCLTQDQKTFNYFLSKIHVHVEHAFAALKGCFQSLWELCHPHLIHWVNCCLILHNMIVCFEEGGEQSVSWAISENPDEAGNEDPEGDGPVDDQTEYGSAGQRFHYLMMQRLFDSPHILATSRKA